MNSRAKLICTLFVLIPNGEGSGLRCKKIVISQFNRLGNVYGHSLNVTIYLNALSLEKEMNSFFYCKLS